MTIPQLKVNKKDKNDVSISLRITKAANGFILKTGEAPIVYSSLEELAKALSEALIKTDWDNS